MKTNLAVVVLMVSGLGAAASAPARAGEERVGPGVREALAATRRVRVMVAFREPRSTSEPSTVRAEEIQAIRTAVLGELGADEFELTHRWDFVSGMAGWTTVRGLERLSADPDVTRIDLDPAAVVHMAEAVPMTHADEVQGMGFTGAGVTVAVLDTGIDTDHPDFAGRIVDQSCFCIGAGGNCCPGGVAEARGPGSAEDDNGHGTNVAGVIAGGGSVAPRGFAPAATLVVIKVLDRTGGGSASSIISALDYVLKSRPEVKVVNLSLGLANLFPGNCDGAASFTTSFATAINGLRGRGTLTFASSGNNGSSTGIAVPGCIGSAVAVGAVYDGDVGSITLGCTDASTALDRVACFSNSSNAVDLLAPGAASTASGVNGGAVTFVGTSQACPAAAGAAALLFSANRGASADRVEQALKSTGVSIRDSRNGLTFPRINVRAAVDAVR